MQIYKSRYTPGVTGNEVHLKIGEKCTYQLLNGSTIDIEIVSDRMSHDATPYLGYEAIASDTGKIVFADGIRIIGWEGRQV